MQRKFTCSKCGQCEFASLDDLETHIVKHHFRSIKALYECFYPKCSVKFPTELACLKHELDVHLDADLASLTLTHKRYFVKQRLAIHYCLNQSINMAEIVSVPANATNSKRLTTNNDEGKKRANPLISSSPINNLDRLDESIAAVVESARLNPMQSRFVCSKCAQCDFSTLDRLETHIVKQHFSDLKKGYECFYPNCRARFPTGLACLIHELAVHLKRDLTSLTFKQMQKKYFITQRMNVHECLNESINLTFSGPSRNRELATVHQEQYPPLSERELQKLYDARDEEKKRARFLLSCLAINPDCLDESEGAKRSKTANSASKLRKSSMDNSELSVKKKRKCEHGNSQDEPSGEITAAISSSSNRGDCLIPGNTGSVDKNNETIGPVSASNLFVVKDEQSLFDELAETVPASSSHRQKLIPGNIGLSIGHEDFVVKDEPRLIEGIDKITQCHSNDNIPGSEDGQKMSEPRKKRRSTLTFDADIHTTKPWTRSKKFGQFFDILLENGQETDDVVCKVIDCRTIMRSVAQLRYHIEHVHNVVSRPDLIEGYIPESEDGQIMSGPRKKSRSTMKFDEEIHDTTPWLKGSQFGQYFDILLENGQETDYMVCKVNDCRTILKSRFRYHIEHIHNIASRSDLNEAMNDTLNTSGFGERTEPQTVSRSSVVKDESCFVHEFDPDIPGPSNYRTSNEQRAISEGANSLRYYENTSGRAEYGNSVVKDEPSLSDELAEMIPAPSNFDENSDPSNNGISMESDAEVRIATTSSAPNSGSKAEIMTLTIPQKQAIVRANELRTEKSVIAKIFNTTINIVDRVLDEWTRAQPQSSSSPSEAEDEPSFIDELASMLPGPSNHELPNTNRSRMQNQCDMEDDDDRGSLRIQEDERQIILPKRRKQMKARKYTTPFVRRAVVIAGNEGVSYRRISKIFDIGERTVWNILKRWKTDGTIECTSHENSIVKDEPSLIDELASMIPAPSNFDENSDPSNNVISTDSAARPPNSGAKVGTKCLTAPQMLAIVRANEQRTKASVIAKMFDTSIGTVNRVLAQYRLEARLLDSGAKAGTTCLTAPQMQAIVRANEQGTKKSDIAKIFDTSINTVYRVLSERIQPQSSSTVINPKRSRVQNQCDMEDDDDRDSLRIQEDHRTIILPKERKQRKDWKQTTLSVRRDIVNARNAGVPYRKIAKIFDISEATVLTILKKWRIDGTIERKPTTGRVQKISNVVEQFIINIIKEDPFKNAVEIKSEVLKKFNLTISHHTIQKKFINRYKLLKCTNMNNDDSEQTEPQTSSISSLLKAESCLVHELDPDIPGPSNHLNSNKQQTNSEGANPLRYSENLPSERAEHGSNIVKEEPSLSDELAAMFPSSSNLDDCLIRSNNERTVHDNSVVKDEPSLIDELAEMIPAPSNLDDYLIRSSNVIGTDSNDEVRIVTAPKLLRAPNSGAKVGKKCLTVSQKLAIVRANERETKPSDIAKIFDTSIETVRRVLAQYRSEARLLDSGAKVGTKCLTAPQMQAIVRANEQGTEKSVIAKIFDTSIETVDRVLSERTLPQSSSRPPVVEDETSFLDELASLIPGPSNHELPNTKRLRVQNQCVLEDDDDRDSLRIQEDDRKGILPKKRKQKTKYTYTPPSIRRAVVNASNEGLSSRQIANMFDINKDTVAALLKRWKTHGTTERKPYPVQEVNKAVEQFVLDLVKEDRFKSGPEIKSEILKKFNLTVSRHTVQKILSHYKMLKCSTEKDLSQSESS